MNIHRHHGKSHTLIEKQEMMNKVKDAYEKYPDLSVKDKAEKVGMSFQDFAYFKNKLGLKQDHWTKNPEDVKKQNTIREEYNTGKYSYADLGRKYGLTRERIRQIVSDLRVKLVAENKLYNGSNKIFTDRLLYILAKAYRDFNKVELKREEVTCAYYHIFTKGQGLNLKVNVTISAKLAHMIRVEKNPYIKRVGCGIYSLTKEGKEKVEKLIKNIEKEEE